MLSNTTNNNLLVLELQNFKGEEHNEERKIAGRI